MKYKHVTIAAVKIVRYEVRDPTGRVLKRTSSLSSAKAYIDGYLSAMKRALNASADRTSDE